MRKALVVLAACLSLAAFGISGSFSLKLSGGAQFLTGGDYNHVVQGQNELYRTTPGSTIGSELKGLVLGWNLFGELIYSATDRLGVGVGVGHFTASNRSTVSMLYGYGALRIANEYAPSLTAIPITLNVHYLLPLGGPFRIHFSAGPGLYYTIFNLRKHYTVGYRSASDLADEHDTFTPHGVPSFGFQGGLGLEVDLSSRVAVCLDIQGRAASSSGFNGDFTKTGTVSGRPMRPWSYSGTLYYSELYGRSSFSIGNRAPSDREAVISLGGVLVLVGIRFSN